RPVLVMPPGPVINPLMVMVLPLPPTVMVLSAPRLTGPDHVALPPARFSSVPPLRMSGVANVPLLSKRKLARLATVVVPVVEPAAVALAPGVVTTKLGAKLLVMLVIADRSAVTDAIKRELSPF